MRESQLGDFKLLSVSEGRVSPELCPRVLPATTAQ